MLQHHLLDVHTQNKYLGPIGTLFMLKWLPSLISNRSESFILVQQQWWVKPDQGPVYMSDFIPGWLLSHPGVTFIAVSGHLPVNVYMIWSWNVFTPGRFQPGL